MAGKTISLVKWQAPMKRVLYALAPAMLASIYFFGWRSLLVLIVVNVAGFLAEYAFARYYKESVSSSIFVSNCLFAMIIPPTLPIWMAVVGIIFGIVFGKMVFGGFGKNVFNPAMVGRAFIYINFAMPMTSKWVNAFTGMTGGFMHVSANDVRGGELATGHLVKSGHKRIAFVSGSMEEKYFELRFKGYSNIMNKYGLEINKDWMIFSKRFQDLEEKVRTVLSAPVRPSALVCMNDEYAMISVNTANKMGLNVPQDLSVVGYGNMFFSQMMNPPLTTISEPYEEVGNIACDLLLKEINCSTKQALKQVIDVTLIERKSTMKQPSPVIETSDL